MNTEKRREALMKRLREASQPLTGTKLARTLGVSRQIIVGDISILRAEGAQIFATPRGYIMPEDAKDHDIKATIVCRHNAADMEKELQAVVDNGGAVLDVIVEHPVYGAIRGDLFVESRRDVRRFLTKMQKCQANPLLVVTGGIHMHTIRVPDEDALKAIEHDLSLARRELQHMALARDVDALLNRVAVDVLALEAVLVELCDLDLALGREVTRHLVPREVIALEGDRCGLRRVNRVAQVLAHLLRIGLELVFLGIRLLGARRAVLVLEVVEQAQARIGIGMIRRGAGCARCCRQDEGRDHQA